MATNRIERGDILRRLNQKRHEGIPIIGGGAGTGLSAKSEAAGGIDLIVIYNSGRYRMAGRGSLAGLLAYGNANDVVVDMAREILPVVKDVPVLAGVNGTDPFCQFDPFLDGLKQMGFSGVQNFPTVGLIDGQFRQNLEETGMGFALEVEMIALAHSKDMLTTPYVFDVEDSRNMVDAGADIVVAHMGLTTGGKIGARTGRSLDDCVADINAIADAALTRRDDTIVLCHGGPISMPDDARYVLERCPNVHGFYGASSMERLPTETAIEAQIRDFTAIRTGGPNASKGEKK